MSGRAGTTDLHALARLARLRRLAAEVPLAQSRAGIAAARAELANITDAGRAPPPPALDPFEEARLRAGLARWQAERRAAVNLRLAARLAEDAALRQEAARAAGRHEALADLAASPARRR